MTNEQLVALIQADIEPQKNLETLYQQNLPLIKSMCKPYSGIEPLEDLMQTAFIGLVEATKHYDDTRGFKFMTLAEHYLKQAIRQYINHSQLIRKPPNIDNLLYRYRRFISAYELENNGLLPPDEEIRHELHINEKQLADLKKYMLCDSIGSLDSPTDEEAGENTLLDYIASPDRMEESTIDKVYKQEMGADVQEAMNIALTKQEQDTIKAYYYDRATLDSIAEQKSITRERVRQQLAQAQRKLSRGRAGKILKEYAKVESMRYIGTFNFFKSHGSIVEYEVMRKDDILENALAKYRAMKRQEQERMKERLAK